jgi:hypothetical protein
MSLWRSNDKRQKSLFGVLTINDFIVRTPKRHYCRLSLERQRDIFVVLIEIFTKYFFGAEGKVSQFVMHQFATFISF